MGRKKAEEKQESVFEQEKQCLDGIICLAEEWNRVSRETSGVSKSIPRCRACTETHHFTAVLDLTQDHMDRNWCLILTI